MNLIPINGNFYIEPIAQKSLFSAGKYQELGKVIAIPIDAKPHDIKIGDTVYFDQWKAGKYPTGEQDENGEEIEFWLIPFEDIRAYVPDKISE
jgi:co-chaperonin GroES (HSP10)